MDAAFVIEVSLRCKYLDLITENDSIFDKSCLILDISRDLLHLEKELPFFVLVDLFALANVKVAENQDGMSTIVELTREFFSNFLEEVRIPEKAGVF